MHLCFPLVTEMEIGGYCLTGLHSTGPVWVHRWVNLQSSSGWLKVAVRLMAVEINWMAGVPVAVCRGCLRACLGSQAVICQSQRVRQQLHPGANLSSSAEGVTAPSISTKPHSFTTGRIYWARGMGGSGRSREERRKGSRMWQKEIGKRVYYADL